MFRLRPWLRAAFPRSTPTPRSSTFRPALEPLEDRTVPTTVIQLFNVVSVDSFAGVGFRDNVVCNSMSASVNGTPDLNKGDFQVQIDWGDGSTGTGDLVSNGSDATKAFYLIKGPHVYHDAGPGLAIPVTVPGPGGGSASALTAYADVTPMPSGIPGTPPASSSSAAPEKVTVQL